ncbi:MAG: VWA domain-containing protein [Planctomycetota bacterium]|nr:VWA domain-containing protein [Planctomycetota bacterium]
MTFQNPAWLLLALPLGLSMWMWPMPSRLLAALRGAVLTMIVLALAGLSVKAPARGGTVVVVADRSLSMPARAAEEQKEIIDTLWRRMAGGDRLAVVCFGAAAAVDHPPQAGRFDAFSADVSPEGSNLAEGIETALSLILPQEPGRVVVVSDGQWTHADPATASGHAAARGVAVDYRCMERPRADDVAVAALDCPPALAPGESFMLTGTVASPVSQEVAYELTGGQTVLATGKAQVRAGLTPLVFRDTAAEPGVASYRLKVTGPAADPVPENNAAKAMAQVRGPKPILHVAPEGNVALARLLAAGKLPVQPRLAAQCRWGLEDLAGFSGVILEDTPAGEIGPDGMANLAAWVSKGGGGLMFTGGRNSYGPGGYFRSPLEPVMPVSMELRREHRKLSLAIVVALDRSGSMSMSAGGGRIKMDLANLGAMQVADLLTGMDQFGCIAVDSSPHEIVSLREMDEAARAKAKSTIGTIGSEGGGIFIYEALQAAGKMIAPAVAGTKHIILFADAGDSEQPGDYRTLLAAMKKAGITVSVIGMGTKTDCDAALLEDIAKRGGGRCFFSDKVSDLPRLFAQDTFVVARSSFLEQKTAVRTTGSLATLTARPFPDMPAIGGYNLCYIRPGASLAALSQDEYKAPIVAAWQAGVGRALCYTGQADGPFTGPLAAWPDAGEFFTSLARWTAGKEGTLPGDMMVTQDVREGVCRVVLHLDPERPVPAGVGTAVLDCLVGQPGSPPEARQAALRWVAPDRIEATLPLAGGQTALSRLSVPGAGEVSLPPVCLPYSPEYSPAARRDGGAELRHIARATGGSERLSVAGLWDDMPRASRPLAMAPWLAIAAIVVLLAEVLERRMSLLSGALSGGGWVFRRVVEERVAKAKKKEKTPKRKRAEGIAASPAAASPGTQKKEEPVEEVKPPRENQGVIDAMEQARRRATRRMDRSD